MEKLENHKTEKFIFSDRQLTKRLDPLQQSLSGAAAREGVEASS